MSVATLGDQTGKGLAIKATDSITQIFFQLKYFTVLERDRLDQIMKEMSQQQTDLVDQSTAVSLGKQMGAQIIVVGNVNGADYGVEKYKCVKVDSQGNKYNAICARANAIVKMNIRMVQVETGEIIFSDVLVGSHIQDYDPAGPPPSGPGMIDIAMAKASRDLYKPIQKAFPLEGIVLKKEGQFIWVDLGSDWGIQKGRGMIIYKGQGQEIRHPVSGEVVGYEREEVAKDQASDVTPTMCKMKVSKKEANRIEAGDPVQAKLELFY
ncbi:MAG: hypothetical protein A2V67_02255 [Deltaproteobacteria bacterium RBG_13_61_14]|nr:MAG: hypothetical protein A2V67_02255 [Deltaproteobacteria bacterium RBG_13_61_14]